METNEIHIPENHQEIMDRFISACQADERIVAAFLGGSYAKGNADQFSDLDLFFITTDEAYKDFLAERESFVCLLGEPHFLEDFGLSHGYFIIFSNGTESEIFFGSESQHKDLCEGPIMILLDKKGMLAGEEFPLRVADKARQVEILSQQLKWFWHEMSHFIKAMGRKQLWFAFGELEVVRQICINLARMRYNFSDPYVGDEPYFKIEQFLPVEQLVPLEKTICPRDYEVMLQAGLVLFNYYQTVGPALAREHGIIYQPSLEQMLMSKFEELLAISSN